MPFIGNQPAESYASFETETFSVSATTNYTLSHAVTNENEIRLVINGVVQQPGSGKAYTASGTTLTLSSATASGDSMYAVYLGRALQTVNPPNASVGNSQTAPTIITGQTAETSIATDDTVLIHDTSASALRKMTRANFVSGVGGDNTPYFYAFNNANQSVSDATVTQVRFNEEVVDTASAFNVSTYRFTPQTAGYYQLHTQVGCDAQSADSLQLAQIFIRKNGTNITNSFVDGRNDEVGYAQTPSVSVVVQANGSSDYFDVTGYVDSSSGSQQFNGSSSNPSTFFWGYKLIG